MHGDWLAATNFERMHEVVSAINTLAIHAKLTLAGIVDPTPGPQIASSRERLAGFLDQLSDAVEEAEATDSGVIVGSDPRLSELTHRFLTSSGQGNQGIRSRVTSPAELRALVRAGSEDSLRRIVPELERLQKLIEEHMQADVADILGDESW